MSGLYRVRYGLDTFNILIVLHIFFFFFFSSRRRHTRYIGDWSSDVCSSDLVLAPLTNALHHAADKRQAQNLVFSGGGTD